jgi:hypothetical protein
MNRLAKFNDVHYNKRAFIACNGPSLNDVKSLEGEIVFALNRGYINKRLNPKYLVFVDRGLANEFAKEIPYHEFEAVFTSKGLYDDRIIYASNVYPIKGAHLKRAIKFSEDITKPVFGGGTVTYLAIQIAYYMGINKLYLIGLDHYRNENDIKHFMKNYFGVAKWNTPKLNKIEACYGLARFYYESNGKEICNASSHTYLKELPRVNLEDII